MSSTEKPFSLQTRLIQGKEDATKIGASFVRNKADEPVWLKILCFVGAVYPILQREKL